MPNTYLNSVDSPQTYTITEVKEIIDSFGLEEAANRIDFDKVPDTTLRTWLKQYESLRDRIYRHVGPEVIKLNGK